MKKLFYYALTGICVAMFSSCTDEPGGNDQNDGDVITGTPYSGMYILSEGAYGQNDARIDWLDFETGVYTEDMYASVNSSVVMELGDVGNDLQLNGDRLYAVVNGSHKVEVMKASTLERIGQVNISSPRAIAFAGNYGYVTSWVDGDNDNGSVVEFDLSTLEITRTISVGPEPEGIAVSNNKLYVANSGGMHYPNYSDEVWTISLSDYSVVDKIQVGVNLHRVVADFDGSIWVNSRGNYYDVSSNLHRITGTEVETFDVLCSGFALTSDKVYYYAQDYDYTTWESVNYFGTINLADSTVGGSFITDETASEIAAPYGIFAAGNKVFIADAENYASSGSLYVYDSDGTRLYEYSTGVCPATAVFLP